MTRTGSGDVLPLATFPHVLLLYAAVFTWADILYIFQSKDDDNAAARNGGRQGASSRLGYPTRCHHLCEHRLDLDLLTL